MDTTTISRLAAATPDTRNRVVDLYRAIAISVVVLGHWLMAAMVIRDGEIHKANTLDLVPEMHGLTWVVQVMPLFFFVGGYANATSWRSARAKGDSWATWQRARLRRLITPVIPLLVAWLGICLIGVSRGVPNDVLRSASQHALIPTWFLAVYVLVIAIVPVTLYLWERFGWWSLVGGMAAAGVVDLVSITADSILFGFLNYLFVWASVHQLGYAWRDGALDGARRRLTLSAIGVTILSALVYLGPYPLVMVGTGEPIQNSYPARATLLFLGMFQIGLALLAERRLQAWLQRPALWKATIAVNARIMTLFLWHMTAMMLLMWGSYALDGWGMDLEPASREWWVTRPIWFVVCGVVTVGLIAIFGRLESPSVDLRPAPSTWRPALATVLVCGGLAVMAKFGVVSDAGVQWIWPALPVAAMLLLKMVPLRAFYPRT